MKEASGELNMTLVTIIAIGIILTVAVAFLPDIMNGIKGKWGTIDNCAPDPTTGKSTC